MATRAQPSRGRICALFGASGVGVTAVVDCICDASTVSTAHVECDRETLPADLIADIAQTQRLADVIFIDALGAPEQLIALVEAGYLGAGAPSSVLVELARGSPRYANKDAQYATYAALRNSYAQTSQLYGVRMRSVQNEIGEQGLYHAITQIADLAFISK